MPHAVEPPERRAGRLPAQARGRRRREGAPPWGGADGPYGGAAAARSARLGWAGGESKREAPHARSALAGDACTQTSVQCCFGAQR
jgi:hypothetical protein